MPLYSYKCKKCEHEEEFLQESNELDPLCPICCWNPDCEGDDEVMERQISKNTGFILKGKGFFGTDYKKTESDKPDEIQKTDETQKTEIDEDKDSV